MRWGRHGARTVDSRIPAALGQHHWDPAVGDRVTAWRGVPAGGALDGNLFPLCGDVWWLHYDQPGPAGYPYLADPHGPLVVGGVRVRKMTRSELRRRGNRWGHAGMKRWTDKHGQHPMTHREGLVWLVAHEVVAAQEEKGPGWARAAWPNQHAHVNCAATGHPAWFKRLGQLRYSRATVVQAQRAHNQIACIWGPKVKGRKRRVARTKRLERRWKGVHFNAIW